MAGEKWFCAFRSQDLGAKPEQLELLGEKLVAFRDAEGAIGVLIDVCPHRGAALSKGSVRDGRLECFYHGWQFDRAGHCLRISTLPVDAAIPRVAHAKTCRSVEKDGYVWVSFAGEGELDPSSIMDLTLFEQDEQYQMLHAVADIEANYRLVLENFLCPAHVFFTHENMAPFMNREHCGPFTTEVETNEQGFYSTVTHEKLRVQSLYEFRYPSMLEVTQKSQWGSTIQQFYVTPLDESRTRLFARGYYPAHLPNFEGARQKFLEIIDQDVYLLPSLQDNAERGHAVWNAPMEADKLPLFGRRYMDDHPFTFGARKLRDKVRTPMHKQVRSEGEIDLQL